MKENVIREDITHTELVIQNIIDRIVDFIPDLIKVVIIFIIGIFLIRLALKLVKKRFEARNISLTVRSFVLSVLRFILYSLLILIVAGNLGIKTTAILGALSGMVLAIGLSLQGSLSNFAGGILILLFRPFDVGDYIENNSGTDGTVEKIDLLYTSLRTSSGILVFSPNGTLANSVIRNFSKIKMRRLQYVVGISYDDNIKEARQTILSVLNQDSRILKTPEPAVFVSDLADSSVNLTVRAWTNRENYWAVHDENRENIKEALDKAGISIPYPQTEMRIISDKNENDSSDNS